MTGILPHDCAASVCINTSRFFSRASRAHSATGWIAPVSLFACITVTRHVFDVTFAATAFGSTKPSSSTGTRSYVSTFAFALAARYSRIAGCSTAVDTT